MPTPTEPVQGTCRLTLEIDRTLQSGKVVAEVYRVLFLHPYPEADPAWRLVKTDGTHYDVTWLNGGTCTCGDFTYRRQQKDPKGCKHCAALRTLGLLRRDS